MNYTYWTEVDLKEYGPCDVNYDVIDGDESVGLKQDYEYTVICGGAFDDYPEGTKLDDLLTDSENFEVMAAIEKDLKDME